MNSKYKQVGFTLIEVLVGMAIIAVTLAAANRSAVRAIEISNELKHRVLADLIAQNRLEMHKAKHDWLTPGNSSGLETQAGIQMIWKETITVTPNPAFRKIVVEVSNADDKDFQLRRLVGFLILEPPKK